MKRFRIPIVAGESSSLLKLSTPKAVTASHGREFQIFTILAEKKYFLLSGLQRSSNILSPLDLVPWAPYEDEKKTTDIKVNMTVNHFIRTITQS